jgi:hypothetical protein
MKKDRATVTDDAREAFGQRAVNRSFINEDAAETGATLPVNRRLSWQRPRRSVTPET